MIHKLTNQCSPLVKISGTTSHANTLTWDLHGNTVLDHDKAELQGVIFNDALAASSSLWWMIIYVSLHVASNKHGRNNCGRQGSTKPDEHMVP
jgi:hypothetical protein